MRNLPIDTSRLTLAWIDCVAVDAYDRDRGIKLAGQQAADQDGQLLWSCNLLAVSQDADGGETLKCKIAASDAPSFAPLDRVELEGLTARPWEQGTRSGISFTASAIRSAGTTNGKTRSTIADPVAGSVS